MPSPRWIFALLALALGWPAQAAHTPADWKLPPVDGELSGEFNALFLGGAPKVKWKLSVQTEKPRERAVQFQVEGYGLHVRGDALVDPMGEGEWRVLQSEIELAEWAGWVVPRYAADFAGVSAAGKLSVTGKGTWKGGALNGSATVSLREGRVDDPTRKVLLEGISVDVEFEDIATWRTAPAQVFTWRSGRYDIIPIGVGRIEFQMDAEKISITSALIDVFGGELQVPSLVMSTQSPEFSVQARLEGVAVEQVIFLLPQILSEARGKLDGHVALRRTSRGIQIGDGRLQLREGETADLRLAVKPGWLTTSLPPVIVKNFPAFQKMERGEVPIRARVLDVTFTPMGDDAGRTARVHVAGGPSDPQMTAPIDTTVNVYGPLEALVNLGAGLGTNSRLSFGGVKIE